MTIANPGQQGVLIADDEIGVRFALGEFLRRRGLMVYEADTCRAAEEMFRSAKPDIAVLDNFLTDGTALDVLPKLKAIDPTVPVIVLTAHASIDLAVRSIKEGAEQFITKPIDLNTISVLIDRLLDTQRSRRRELAARNHSRRLEPDPFFGSSPLMRTLHDQARRIAGADSSVVIQGETGSDKGVLARWLHRNGPRADEPFVDLNCAGLSRDFLETELFGHQKGAFTSAVTSKPGLLEIAHHGTLFLDEIGDVDALVQPKLLKVLEDKRFRRLGEVKDRTVDVRIIAASHHDLATLVRQGKFRSDLYFRINTIPLRVPALRDRVQDIPLLAERLLADLSTDLGRPGKTLSGHALDQMCRYDWPGNVRELRNVIERAILLHPGEVIEPGHLLFDSNRMPTTASPPAPIQACLTLEQMERHHIEQVLRWEQGNVPNAAKRLGIPRSSLYQKLKKMDISFGKPSAEPGDLPDTFPSNSHPLPV
ncbi:MAG: sigma-54 dependent transcriptional regulator [Acidobacteriaceae bacterium]